MDPATIALIVAGITEAMKFAVQGAQLIEDAHKLDLSPKEVQARWDAIRDAHYATSRKAWDDAGGQQA